MEIQNMYVITSNEIIIMRADNFYQFRSDGYDQAQICM